jgi:hypothetical protein
MNFDRMAKIVHDLVQRQNSGESDVLISEAFQGMTLPEQESLCNGFSKLRLSEDAMASAIGPNVHWA